MGLLLLREGPCSFTLNVSVAIVLCLSLEFVDDQFHVLFASKKLLLPIQFTKKRIGLCHLEVVS